MVKNTISILVILLVLGGCKKSSTTVNIAFGEKVNFILLNNSHLNLCYNGFLDTVKVGNDGVLNLKFDIKETRFMYLKAPEISREFIIPLEPGSDYSISMNEKPAITGSNSEGVQAYQSVLQFGPRQIKWSKFNNDSTSREDMIEKSKQDEMNKFKTLLKKKEISKQLYDLIKNDRDCFYAFVSTWLDSWDQMDYYRSEISKDTSKRDEALSRSTATFSKYNPNDKNLLKSPTWQNYALFMYIFLYKQYLAGIINNENVEKILSDEHIPFWFEQIKSSFSGDNAEAALAVFLHQSVASNLVSEANMPVYEYFKKEYPNSPYLKYFEDYMQKSAKFFHGENLNPSIHFVENMQNSQTFDDLISQFKGEKLYVDVWATWCNPCRAEFQYSDSLHVILQKNNITPLYISIDEDNNEKNWKALVYTHNLEGVHFRANKAFINDLNKIYTDNESDSGKKSFPIPWYIFIDENGKIIEKHFMRPSEIIKDENALKNFGKK